MTRPTTDARSYGLDPGYERELIRQSAATRRAIVLGALTLILLATLVLAILAVLPQWAPIAAAIPVIAFVAAAVMTSAERQRPAMRQTSSRPFGEAANASRRMAAPAAAPAVEDDWETWNAWDDDEESWEAVPATLPTYVTAPRASAVPRGIDRSRPGEWTGSAMVETAQAMRRHRRADPIASASEMVDHGAETAEIPVVQGGYEPRRAVNE